MLFTHIWLMCCGSRWMIYCWFPYPDKESKTYFFLPETNVWIATKSNIAAFNIHKLSGSQVFSFTAKPKMPQSNFHTIFSSRRCNLQSAYSIRYLTIFERSIQFENPLNLRLSTDRFHIMHSLKRFVGDVGISTIMPSTMPCHPTQRTQSGNGGKKKGKYIF